jgi:hypothetical protein
MGQAHDGEGIPSEKGVKRLLSDYNPEAEEARLGRRLEREVKVLAVAV